MMSSININENNELLQNLETVLGEQIEGIRLNELENVYKKKFSKSLFIELIKLVFPNELDNRFTIISENQNNSTTDVIKLTNQKSNEQIETQLIQQIATSEIVSDNFDYHVNPIIFKQTNRFVAYLSNIDQNEMLIYMQPECDLPSMQNLTELLHGYYSLIQSEKLIVENPRVGLACVSKYDEVYHRTIIKEIQSCKYVVQYVDIGLTMIIEKSDKQFKYLLNCFAECFCIAIPCYLAGIEFKLQNSQMPFETYQKLKNAFKSPGPFFILPYKQVNKVLHVQIYDYYEQCLNTLLVQEGLAVNSALKASDISSLNDQMKSLEQRQLANSSHENKSEENTSSNHSLPGEYAEYDNESVLLLSTNSNSSLIKPQNSQTDHNDTMSKERPSMKITINRSLPNHRIFASSLKEIFSNNKRFNHKKNTNITIYNSNQKRDDYAEWMCCSRSEDESLWLSDKHKTALLKYIGRIYNQVTNMYRIFTQLRNINDLDELDILNKLIINAKQRQKAQSSFNKWQDNSRITRRIQDLRIIFEFNSNSIPSNHPFIIETNGCEKIIEGQNIKSYFDLGCGDGTITAEIGRCLQLSRTNIFGGDVFEVQNENITFIKLCEDNPTINLPTDCVDLVTSFVTFHHVPEIRKTLAELVRILRRGGYLIIREHDCENKRSLSAKYLNFVHAIMMIAGVGEFADSKNANQPTIDRHSHNCEENWEKQKSYIIEYTKSIKYKSHFEWQNELKNVGFRYRATLRYGANGSENPQNLFYAIYQLENK